MRLSTSAVAKLTLSRGEPLIRSPTVYHHAQPAILLSHKENLNLLHRLFVGISRLPTASAQTSSTHEAPVVAGRSNVSPALSYANCAGRHSSAKAESKRNPQRLSSHEEAPVAPPPSAGSRGWARTRQRVAGFGPPRTRASSGALKSALNFVCVPKLPAEPEREKINLAHIVHQTPRSTKS